VAADKGVSVSQLVLRWTSLQPAITVVLAGARNAEQAIANAEATAIDLTIDELSFIDTALSKI